MRYSKVRKPFILSVLCLAVLLPLSPAVGQAECFFEEGFDDGNFTNRDWNGRVSNITLSTSVTHSGKSAAQFSYDTGTGGLTQCRTNMFKTFNSTRSIYISYWVNYSSDWRTNNTPIDQRVMYVLTSEYPEYATLSHAPLTIYSIISRDCPGFVTLKIATLKKDGYKTYWEGSKPGALTVDAWHNIELFAKLNSSAGMPDGEIQLSVDGKKQLEHTNVVFRIRPGGDNTPIDEVVPTTIFNQLVISPYIFRREDTGSLNFYIDELKVCDSNPEPPPSAPQNVRTSSP
jgi:hypothetical protein